MRILFLIIVSTLFFSCTENDKKLDVETNTYYSKYKFIFEKYDSLGTEASILLLDEYIQEFPNAIDAYKFKAFLLAKDKNFVEIEKTLKEAKNANGNELEINNYYVSLLLRDTLNLNKAEAINSRLNLNNQSNLETLHNNFWINLYQKKFSFADSLSATILAKDTTSNINYLRAPFILAAASKDLDRMNTLKKNDVKMVHINLLDSVFLDKISLQDYYQLLSK